MNSPEYVAVKSEGSQNNEIFPPKRRKKRRKRAVEEEETVFNYMTGLYEKVKRVRAKTEANSEIEIIDITEDDGTEDTTKPQNNPLETNQPSTMVVLEASCEVLKNLTSCHWDVIPQAVYICQRCKFSSTSKLELIFHLYRTHLQNACLLTLECKRCRFSSLGEKEMFLHEKNRHGVSEGDNISLSKDIDIRFIINEVYCHRETRPLSNQNQRTYQCFDCGFETSHLNGLEEHSSKHPASNFKCSEHQNLEENCLKCIYKKCLSKLNPPSETATIRNEDTGLVDQINGNNRLKQPQKFKCFHCDFVATSRSLLKFHASKHYNQQFRCRFHGYHPTDSCDRCQYTFILEEVNKELFLCQECGFKTFVERTFLKHQKNNCRKSADIELASDSWNIESTFRCFDCDYTTWRKDFLKNHAVKHKFSTFTCSDHRKVVDNCLKCIYKGCLLNCQQSNGHNNTHVSENTIGDVNENTSEEVTNTNAKIVENNHFEDESLSEQKNAKAEKFTCFDCDYKSARKELLIQHAMNHENSTFKCPDHEKISVSCPKCIYKSCLMELPLTIKKYNHCGYKPTRNFHFAEHQCTNKATSDSFTYKCYHCTFRTIKKDLLLQHAIRHENRIFICPDHDKITDNCPKCIYKSCLMELPLKIKEYNHCGYKTTRDFRFAEHQCTNKAHPCPIDNETGKTINEEEDSAAGSGDEASKTERNLRAHNKIFKCFDCEYEAPRKDYLLRHVVWHENSNFYCTDHNEIKTDCPKCVYKSVLNDLPRKMRVCNDCGYKTCRNDNFARHPCSKSKRSNNQSPSFDIGNFKCSLCSFKASSLQTLKQHASLKHLDEYFECDLHRHAKAASCQACSYEVMLKEIENEAYKCRNCDFKALERAAVDAHQGKCRKLMHSESLEVSGEDVNIEAADSLEDDTTPEANGKRKHVALSGDEASVIEAHEEGIHKSSFNTLSLKCFECARFNTNDIEKLKEHSIVHSRSTFQCDMHEFPELNHECNKCVYVSLKLSAKNDAFVCQVCDFLTLKQDVFREHQKHCGIGQVSTIIDITEEESDPEISTDAGAVQGGNLEYGVIEHYDYHCYDCAGQKFRETAYFERHVNSHNESSYKCPDHLIFTVYCKKCVYQYAVMGVKLGKYICKYCSFKDTSLEPVLIHMRGNCMVNVYRGDICHMCFHCGSKSESREVLWKHSLQHHSNYYCLEHHMKKKKTCPKCFYAYLIAKNNRDKTVTCEECQRKFKSSFDLWMHVEEMHTLLYWATSRNVSVREHLCDCKNCQKEHNLKRASMTTRRKCPLCKHYYITNKDTTKHHLEIKHQTATYHCRDHLSEKQYAYCYQCCVERLLQLIQGGVREKVCCDCNYICEELEDLVFHVLVHHFDSIFQCSQHFLSEIDPACDMCVYESIVLCIE